MDCPECDRLQVLRDRLEIVYASALGALRTEAEAGDSYQYMRLRSEVQAAKLGLDLATAEFRQHQDRHATVN